jgi:SAM-dependent methyltransferase
MIAAVSMTHGQGSEYFVARKMGRQLLKSPYDSNWWNNSKYRLCIQRFDPLPGNARVLDLACGLGQAAYYLATIVGEVTGVDLSTFAIQFARANYHRQDLRYVQANIFQYEPEVPVDAVFCMDFIEHLDLLEGRKLLQRILGFLNPGGRLYAHVPIARSSAGARKLAEYKRKNPDHGPIIDHTGDETHKSIFSVPEFRTLLKECGFDVVGEIRKVHCWRPVRWLYRGFLSLPGVPVSWRDQATYSYIVQALRAV